MKKLLMILIVMFLAVNVFAVPGEGAVTIEPTDVIAGQTGVYVGQTYTAGATTWNNGEVILIIPTGWSAPSITGTEPGYVSAVASEGDDLTIAVEGQHVTITVIALTGVTGTIEVYYGSKDGGGPGAQVAGPGTATFTWLTAPEGGTPAGIVSQPTITVSEPTPTPSDTPTETFTETDTETPTETPTETFTETDTDTPTETFTETDTDTPTETFTDTPTDTPTQTPTFTPTVTPTVTPTATQHVYGDVVYQPYAVSGKVVISEDTSFFSSLRWRYFTVDSLTNTSLPIRLYDGEVLLRTLNIYTLPYVINMEDVIVKEPIIDFMMNTGTSTHRLKK